MQKTMEDGFTRASKCYMHPMRMQEDSIFVASILSPFLRGWWRVQHQHPG